MDRKLRVGVIGVGGIAKTHFPGWKASPDAELVALADPFEKPLEAAAQEQGVTRTFIDPKEMIADPDIDIIDVCTPNSYHAPLTIAALQAGKHVICEKPLAPTPGEIKQMIKARDKSKKLLMTAQHFRFQSNSKALKAEIDAGALGNIYHARGWMLRRAAAPTRPSFTTKKHAGGGPCIDIGVHILDLTLWFMGNPKPVAVSGITQDKLRKLPNTFSPWGGALPKGKDWDVEEFAAAFVRFDTGATLILEVSWLLHHKTTGEDMQMWLYGDKGGSHWPNLEILQNAKKGFQHLDTKLAYVPHAMEPHALECVAFADAVAHGKPSPVPAEQSLDVIAILDGLYRSAKSGREVRL